MPIHDDLLLATAPCQHPPKRLEHRLAHVDDPLAALRLRLRDVVASAIGGKELVYAAKAVGSKTYDVMYPYIGIAVIYLVMVMLLTWLQGKLERRLRQSDRR